MSHVSNGRYFYKSSMALNSHFSLLKKHTHSNHAAWLFLVLVCLWVILTRVFLIFPITDSLLHNSLDFVLDFVFIGTAGGVLYIFHRRWNDVRVRRLTHLYATLSLCNQIIVRSANMRELLPEICRNAVRLGGMKLAWIGLVEESTGKIIPVASSGEGIEYLDGIEITTDANNPRGLGPVGTAVRENRPVWCQDFQNDPNTTPWQGRAAQYKWGAIAALPLRRKETGVGVLCLYTGVVNAFDEAERALLEEMAQNISYALDNYERDEARTNAEVQVRNVLAMTQHFLDNLPGSAYIKDSELHMLFASRGFIDMFGFEQKVVVGKSTEELFPGTVGEKMSDDDRLVFKSGETIIVNEKINNRHFETIKFVIDDQGDNRLLGGITLDITQRHLLMARQQALLEINELGALLSESEFLERGIAIAARLTDSEVSFQLFVNENKPHVKIAICSENAKERCCEQNNQNCIFNDASYWGECISSKKVAVFNDYEEAMAAKGLPPGSMVMTRMLAAPVIEDDVVRMIVGVANKPSDYDDADIVTLLLISNDLWKIVHRRRMDAAVQQQLEELKELNRKLEETHNQLLQSEKMAAIGRLAAGVAHEINNPVSFVQSNFGSLTEYVSDLLEIGKAYKDVEQQIGPQYLHAFERVHRVKEKAGYDFIVRDVKQLIGESREGLERVSRIVRDLCDFSRVGETGWRWVDLHEGLDSTIKIVQSVVKEKFEIEREYGALPDVYCMPAQLNQVFLNLLVNAAQSVKEEGRIGVHTGRDDKNIWIEVQDNGAGISQEHKKHLFEPFFTTKPPGKGTGLGLSLSWGIVQRHKGTIDVYSEPGIVTKFKINLPIDPRQEGI
jgi:signal transduction histidine kinase/PAS domain-containing protein